MQTIDDNQILSGLTEVPELSEFLNTRRERLHLQALVGDNGLLLVRAYSDLVDSVVLRMLAISCEAAGKGITLETVPISVVATGGYGRRELCPYSDIDITFVPLRDGDSVVDRVVKRMFTLLMQVFIDRCGLSVGYAYRLLADLGDLDHQTQCGLLDARLIGGSTRIFIKLEGDYWGSLNPTEFLFTKLAERELQRDNAGKYLRTVEPQLKDGAGGLRDFQTAVWIAQACATREAAQVRGDRAFDLLRERAGLQTSEIEELARARELLFRTRNALHVVTRAERDHLIITRQEDVAVALGYRELPPAKLGSRHPGALVSPLPTPAVEQFMADLSSAMATIHNHTEAVVRALKRTRMVLGIGLDYQNSQVVSAGRSIVGEEPEWVFDALGMAQEYGLTVADDLLAHARTVVRNAERPPDRRAAEVFGRMLASRKPIYPTLQCMAEIGALGWLIPEFGRVLNLIPYDAAHEFTIGQHTLFVVQYLDKLREKCNDEDLRDLHAIMQELTNPEQLYMAALMHDCGKSFDARGHSESGDIMARNACERLGWDAEATARVCSLVRHHLLMSATAGLRDLTLPDTIDSFTCAVNDMDTLQMLYLLTYADMHAVGENVWRNLIARQLRDLYYLAERNLAGDVTPSEGDENMARTRHYLKRELSIQKLSQQDVADHVEGMPPNYLLSTSLPQMAMHIDFVARARSGEHVVEFQDERNSSYTELTICTPDAPLPGLLSRIAGTLYALDCVVHSAQVVTRFIKPRNTGLQCPHKAEHIAIDTLYVDFKGRQLTPGKCTEIANNLKQVLSGEGLLQDLLERRRRKVEGPGAVTRITARNNNSGSYAELQVWSEPDSAMLYRVSHAISELGWSILSARISHSKGLTVANFYVTGARGVAEEEIRQRLARLVMAQPAIQTVE